MVTPAPGAEAEHRGAAACQRWVWPFSPAFADEQAGTQRLTAGASLGAQMAKDPPAVQETRVQSLVRKIPPAAEQLSRATRQVKPWSLCSAAREATAVRGPRAAARRRGEDPSERRGPSTARNTRINAVTGQKDLGAEAPGPMRACISVTGGTGPGLNTQRQPALYPRPRRTQASQFAASESWVQGGRRLGLRATF